MNIHHKAPNTIPSPLTLADDHPFNRFHRRRVAITGGTSGLGLALVRELLNRSAEVALLARSRDRVKRVAQELSDAHGIVGDVSRKEDIYPIAMQIVGALGGLDVLINNASDLGPAPLKLLADTECEDFERALATNVLGPFRLTKALLGSLAASAREGRIGGGQCVERRRRSCLPALGRIWREQGSATSFEPHLGRRTPFGGRPGSLNRSRRYGHTLARCCRAGCRPLNVEAPRGGSPRTR